jgi:hypothetical protein
MATPWIDGRGSRRRMRGANRVLPPLETLETDVRAVSQQATSQHMWQDRFGAHLTEVSTKLSKLAETELANHTAKSK